MGQDAGQPRPAVVPGDRDTVATKARGGRIIGQLKRFEHTRPGRWGLFGWTAVRNSVASARGHPLRALEALGRMLSLYAGHRFWPNEVLRLGLLENAERVEHRFISKQRLLDWQRRLNPPACQPYTEDKVLFHAICRASGIRTATLLGVFLPGHAGFQAHPRKPLSGPCDWRTFFIDHCPRRFVVKPAGGVYGEGVQFVHREDPAWSADDLYAKLERAGGGHIIEECLSNHPHLYRQLPKLGLQTARIVTFVHPGGEVEVVHADFKVIVGGNRIDNHRIGTTSNLLCNIDLATGTLATPLRVTPRGFVKVPRHPDSGRRIGGMTLPSWDEACALARAAAREFLPLRAIGWDVAFTPEGPAILEGNARWDPPKSGVLGEAAPLFATTGAHHSGKVSRP